MASLGELFVTVGAKIDGFEKSMGTVSQRLNAIDREAEKAGSGFDKLGGRMMEAGGMMSAALTLPILGLGAAAVTVGGQFEQTTIAFTTLLKSGDAAKVMLDDLKTFAAGTPFEFPELTAASQRMMALGFSASEVIPTLTIIGDTASAMGKGADGINNIVLALGQMRMAGKVTAQDMNQLIAAGVNAWQYLADAAGKSIAEVKKMSEEGMLNGAAAAQVILAGMQRDFGGAMKDQSATLLGQWSNFKDQITFTLMDIGKTLLPIAKDMLTAIQPLLGVVRDMAAWFGQLPAPVRNVALGLAALVAAIGPLLLAVGGIISAATTIGTAFTAMSGVALPALGTAFAAVSGPVLAVVAALVALGVWVYAYWDEIVAVVKQAWDGLVDLWGAVWGVIGGVVIGYWNYLKTMATLVWDGIVLFFKLLWAPVQLAFTAVWSVLGDTLTAIWNGLKSVAIVVWGAIVDAIKEFVGWLQKIPGVSKLLNLDDAWNSVKKGTAALKDNSEAHKGNQGEATKTGKATANLALIQEDAAKAAKKAEDAQKEYEKALKDWTKTQQDARTKALAADVTWNVLIRTVKAVSDEHKRLFDSVVNLKAQLATQPDYIDAVNRSMDEMADKIEAARIEADRLRGGVPLMSDAVVAAMNQAKGPTDTFGNALKQLGITSTTEYNTVAAEAKKAYEAIAGSGIATQFEKDNAMLRMLKAQADAMRANGQSIPADMAKLMADLESKVGEKSPGIKGKFDSLAHSISQVMADLSKDILDSLFEGEMSWAEKGMAALKKLGEAVLSFFVTPAAEAIGKFVAETIADLLSGRGLGGVLDNLKEIGSSITSIFGGATSAAGTAGASGGGAAGAAGSAGSTGAGWAGVVGAIGSVVTAVSSIVSNFQQMGMNKSLDIIVKHTLQTVMIGESTWDLLDNRLTSIHSRLMEFRTIGIKVFTDDRYITLDPSHISSMERGFADVVSAVREWVSAQAEAAAKPLNVIVSVDGRAIAAAMVGYLDDAGAHA